MPDLKNKVTLITGAASGIGQATAVHFASLGAKLSLADLSPNLEETLKLCLEQGLTEDEVQIQICDVSHETAQEELVRKTVEHFGQLDILINNAGVQGKEQTLENLDMEVFNQIMDINFKAGMRLIHLCLPHLKKTKGSVVNVSSVGSKKIFLHSLAYSASKAAVDQLTRFAAKQLSPFGIRVNSVNPGSVKTNIRQSMGMTKEQLDKLFSQINKNRADPMEIAKPIAFLASSDASFVTGINMLVDGGMALD